MNSRRTLTDMKKHAKGFTLVEMAIVLVIIGLLLGGLLMPLSTQIENTRRNDTEKSLEALKQAVIGFALVNGRLPCPDKADGGEQGPANDGQEDRNPGTGVCVSVEGNLPWVTLGTVELDSWGNRYRYRVTGSFADGIDGTGCGTATPGVSFELCSVGDMTIVNEVGGRNVATNIPAIILSVGKNGLNAVSNNEIENTNTDSVFVDHIYTDNADPLTNPQGVIDDLIVWVSPNILFNRMVAAGRLP